MQVNVEKQEQCRALLTATVPAADVTKERDAVIAVFTLNAKFPGFRPGKTPKSIVAKRLANEIQDSLTKQLIDQIFNKAIESDPTLKILDFGKPEHSFNDEGDFCFSSTLTLIPHFELPPYMGLSVTEDSLDVSDQNVEEYLQHLAEQTAKYESQSEHVAQQGDVVVIDFTSELDGKPLAEAIGKPVGFLEGRNDQWIKVEEDSFLPGFATAFEGAKVGDSKDIPVTVPDTFPHEELRGKTLLIHATVKDVRVKQLPTIDDAFAASLLPDNTLDQLKDHLRRQLKANKESDNEHKKGEQIIDQLTAACSFDLPELAVERETYGLMQETMQQAVMSGMPHEDLEKLVEEQRPLMREKAMRKLRSFFILLEIAKKEGVKVTELDMAQEIERRAGGQKKAFKAMVKDMRANGELDSLRMNMTAAKALQFLVEHATVTPEQEQKQEQDQQ